MFLTAIATLAVAAPQASGVQVEAGFFASLPVVLDVGQGIGPGIGASWAIEPWSLGGRLRFTFVDGDDEAWRLNAMELHALATGAYFVPLGAGTLGVGLSLGAVGIREARQRHQAQRLANAGLATERLRYGLGPEVGVDIMVRVSVWGPLSLSLMGGPLLAVPMIDGRLEARLGWAGGALIAYASWLGEG